MKVRDIMTSAFVSCQKETDIGTAARLMLEGRFGTLPVVDTQDTLVGIITDRDIAMAAATRRRNASQIAVPRGHEPACPELLRGRRVVCRAEADGRGAGATPAGPGCDRSTRRNRVAGRRCEAGSRSTPRRVLGTICQHRHGHLLAAGGRAGYRFFGYVRQRLGTTSEPRSKRQRRQVSRSSSNSSATSSYESAPSLANTFPSGSTRQRRTRVIAPETEQWSLDLLRSGRVRLLDERKEVRASPRACSQHDAHRARAHQPAWPASHRQSS